MQKFSLDALARELLEKAATSGGRHTAQTVVGGHELVLRQTMVAMIEGATLAEHESPGEATLLVIRGRVRLSAGDASWEPRTDRIRVEIRLSTTGWAYAPKAYWLKGNRIPIADVIGRWVETEESSDGAKDAICFMVRTEKGQELTLVHLVAEDSWELR